MPRQRRAASGAPLWTVKARKGNTRNGEAAFVTVGTGFGEQTNGGILVELHAKPFRWDGRLYLYPVMEEGS